MIEEYINLIRNVEHFTELTDSEIIELLQQCEIIELDDEEYLFKQNDRADAMYILISGYLLISVEHENHNVEHISSVHPGEVTGELGLFSNKPRSASAKALLKSKLLKLSSKAFFRFIHAHPHFVETIIPILADRAHHALRLATRIKKRPFHKHIMLISFGQMGDDFIEELKRQSGKNKKIHYCEQTLLMNFLKNNDALGLLNYLDHLEKYADVIIYNVTSEFIKNQEKCVQVLFRRTNTLVFASQGGMTSTDIPNTYQTVSSMIHPELKIELILLWQKNDYVNHTIDWLKQCPYNMHHHIIIDDSKDYQRFIRYICGKAIGLVLSGGGSRVWYHLGVMRAIMEKGIPIDAIGGTSAGAVVAAYYLMYNNIEEMLSITKKFSKSIQQSLFIKNLTYPLISLYNAKPTTKMAKSVFQERRIEDLPRPYFAVCTNMNSCAEYVMMQGLIWKAVRATAALPGIYPPLEYKGQLLFDGGLLNNLPTDHMRRLLGDQAIIIASDISIDEQDFKQYIIPPSLPLWQSIKGKLPFTKKKIIHPPFISTLIKALLVGSVDHYRRNLKNVNYHISSDLSKFSLFIFDQESIQSLIQAGYDTANEILKDINKST